MQKVLSALDAVSRVIAKVRSVLARVNKFLVVAVPTVGLIIGTDSPLYVKVVAILVSLGVFTVPNKA